MGCINSKKAQAIAPLKVDPPKEKEKKDQTSDSARDAPAPHT